MTLLVIPITVSSCRTSKSEDIPILESVFELAHISEVVVNFPSGVISLYPSQDSQISSYAKLANPENLQIKQEATVLTFELEKGNRQDELELYIPDGVSLQINTYSANISADSFSGEISIRSTSGNISLDSFDGQINLWAGRGNISVLNGTGDLVLFGEHGNLSVEDFNGSVSMTTIMGTINYTATNVDKPSVHLESDHGAVKVLLTSQIGSKIEVVTTSGFITCTGAGLSQTVDGCIGTIGNGDGEISVRTVSGKVDLSVIESREGIQND